MQPEKSMSERARSESVTEENLLPAGEQPEYSEELEADPLQEKEAASALDFALHRLGQFMSSSKEEPLPKLTPEQEEELREIKQNAGAALQTFFRRIKTAVKIAPVLALLAGPQGVDKALETYAGDKPASPEDNLLRNSSVAAAVAEWYFGENLLETIDTYERLAAGRIDGKMGAEETAFRERISDNVFPGTQAGLSGTRTEFRRLKEQFRNFEQDTKKYSRKGLEDLPQKEIHDKWFKEATQIRSDMFRLYLGLVPRFDYLEESRYKPTKAKNPDTRYVSFPAKRMIESMRMVGKGMHETGELDDGTALENEAYAGRSFDAFLKYVEAFKALPVNSYTPSLGRYMVDQGYDEVRKERYVSYYDIWNLDIAAFKAGGIDLDRYNFPFEVYGRIYESDF